MFVDVGVVGAGIVGLSTAISIQKLIQMSRVTIIADSFGEDTYTPVSRPIFFPILSRIQGIDEAAKKNWLTDSWNHHYEMAKSPEGVISGQRFMSGHCLWSHLPEGQHFIEPSLVMNYQMLTETEMLNHNFNYQYGAKFTTVAIEPSTYLRWLMKEFRKRGGQVISDTVYALEELYGKFDAVVNCTGRRARELVQDPFILPIKGHAVQVQHEYTKKFFVTGDDLSVVPSNYTTTVSVGHILEYDIYERYLDEDLADLLLHKVKAMVPHLVGSKVISKHAERTPWRSPPLIRTDLVDCGGPILPVVHNLGFGTDSVTLAWGSGAQAAHLVQDVRRAILPYCRYIG